MKRINRTVRMDTAQALKDGKVLVYANEPGGLRKIRCPKCQCLAAPTTDMTTNKTTIRCPSCGSVFTSTSM